MLAPSCYAIAWKRAAPKLGQNPPASEDLAWTLSMPVCLKPPGLATWILLLPFAKSRTYIYKSCWYNPYIHRGVYRWVCSAATSRSAPPRRGAKGHPQGVLVSCMFGTASPPGMGFLDGEEHMEIAHPFPLRSCFSELQKASGSGAIRSKPLNDHAAEEN